MKEKPILSIVTPTIGTFSNYWLEQLLKIRGNNIEFILVYPPGEKPSEIDDNRVKILISPAKGELMQRLIGLLNASGDYIIALDDDDFIHPDILKITLDYFKLFPDSWILRPSKKDIDYLEIQAMEQNWQEITDIFQLEINQKTAENPYPFQRGNYKGLLEIPIAPLDNKFDIKFAIWPFMERKDMEGLHFENFNNILWRNNLVQEALFDLSQTLKIVGNLTWLPSWSLDRLLGLYVQAKYYQKDLIIGHAMPNPEQIRYIVRPPSLKGTRLHFSSDALLAKRFPQYGYLWNLFFKLLYDVPRVFVKTAKRKMFKSQNG